MSYYDKILANNKKTQPKHSKKLITLDDSLAEDDDKPDIFNEPKNPNVQKGGEVKKQPVIGKQSFNKNVEIQKKRQIKNRGQNSDKVEPRQKKLTSQKVQNETKKQELVKMKQIEQINYEEPEVHGVSRKSWLSLMESFTLSLGHYFYSYRFPLRRQIPIIANNLDLQRQKYQNGTYISQSFDNNLQVSFVLFFLRAVLMESFLRMSVILWVIALILAHSISPSQQFRPGKEILLAIFVFYSFMSVVLGLLSLKNRRSWSQPSVNTKYKVYHFDNETRGAEWVLTDVVDLKPGNIYKVPASASSNISIFPADSVLLHSERTILQVDQSPIIEYLSPLEKQEKISLKETLIKSDVIMLPLTGVVHYELAAPEVGQENIYGRFTQQEPTEETFNIGYSNVVLRGTKIVPLDIVLGDEGERKLQQKQGQILAVVLETGIDSLALKTSQYPYQFRKQYSHASIVDNLMIVCSILYILVTGAGILIGYIYLANESKGRGYHIETYLELGESPITLAQIVLHYFGNLIMILPIFLRVSYLLFVSVAAKITDGKIGIQIKDTNMVAEASECDVLVTTIGSDLIRMGHNKYANQSEGEPNIFDSGEDDRPIIKNRSLQSIRVSGIHHNFFTTRIENQLYSAKDVDMICYFMSIALLTCNRKAPTPLEGGIIERCNKELNLKIQKFGTTLKIGQLKVIKIFTIPATEKFPYKILFYRHAKQVVEDLENAQQEPQQKVLCLIRGETSKLVNKISEVDGHLLSEFSNRLHQEKGFHIELLGKFVLSYQDFLQIRRAYLSGSASERTTKADSKMKNDQSLMHTAGTRYRLGIEQFYDNLDRYMLKVDPMGLLVWQNPYRILSSSLSPISSLGHPCYKIIIAPGSKSQTNPQFESVHAITNYLLKTSKLSLKEISSKILHSYSNQQTFWSLLNSEKILVLNGWDYPMIKKMLSDLRNLKRPTKKPVKLFAYIEQDEYAWLLKQCDLGVTTKGDGHDLEKYSDILITTESSPTTAIIKTLFLYSQSYGQCLTSIITCQLMKAVLLATIQFINMFYTWGTALPLIGSPLYLILEIGLLFDFLYHLFPRISEQPGQQLTSSGQSISRNEKQIPRQGMTGSSVGIQKMMMELVSGMAIGSFITFIPLYSMTEPSTPNGTVEPKEFTNLVIHFILYHVVVFRKIFMKPYTFSIYKLFVLILQVAVYYIGILVISAVDGYQYKGAIWFLIEGKVPLIALFAVWMVIAVYWLAFMISSLLDWKPRTSRNKYEKLGSKAKKQEELSVNQFDMRAGEVVEME